MNLVAPVLCIDSWTQGGNPSIFWDSRKCALPTDMDGHRCVHTMCDCRWFVQVNARRLRCGWYVYLSASILGHFLQINSRPGKRFAFVRGYKGPVWSHYANRTIRCQ